MQKYRIGDGALKMAWKMVDTVFARVEISSEDRNRLLNSVTLIALSDLLDEAVFWAEEVPSPFRLAFRDRSVILQFRGCPGDGLLKGSWIRSRPTDRAVGVAVDQADTICDAWGFDEEERDSLFTAIPCLGLQALRDYLAWRKAPPFSELG